MSLLSARREVSEFRQRYRWMAVAVVAIFLVIFGRIVQIQLLDYEKYAAIAKENITKTIGFPAVRGKIVDSTGIEIAHNQPAYRLFITPHLVDFERDIPLLKELMGLSKEEVDDLSKRISDIPPHRRTQRIEVLKKLSRNQVAALETHANALPGFDVVVVPVRTYPFADLAAHAIGYVNEVNADDLKRIKGKKYRAGDRIGRVGIEKAYEEELRGEKGFKKIVVDARGRVSSESQRGYVLDHKEPKPGLNLKLNLDMSLMKIIKRAFTHHPSGGMVVVEVETGRLKALFSKPAYNLNDIAGGLTRAMSQELNENPYHPRIDKTIYESHFPGSTLKPIVALAGLREGVIDEHEKILCKGYYELGTDKKRCTQVHGEVDLESALVQSCNVWFYHTSEKLGLDRIASYAKKFGLAKKTGIRINTETKGFFPTRAWYAEKYKTPFRLGYTLNEAIGQGNTRVTLVQLAMVYAALANGGKLYRPLIVDSILDPNGRTLRKMSPRIRSRLQLNPRHLQLVKEGLDGVVNDIRGTAYHKDSPEGVRIAGKTGTAQVSRHRAKDGETEEEVARFSRDHAWFAGFAPIDNPEVAFVVFLEHGGAGGRYAAPVGLKAMREYFAKHRKREHVVAN